MNNLIIKIRKPKAEKADDAASVNTKRSSVSSTSTLIGVQTDDKKGDKIPTISEEDVLDLEDQAWGPPPSSLPSWTNLFSRRKD
ncbi:hypothetical protein M378DRAFT_154859 [Amanita muscaria Koide BX008]|uniref:Uncharacterized protein n=1 Tax=Amanita muscaria (strain Koide BX008) TaxID=946122 RepID=A0A0C2TVF0_AMAMK|nr:hypothetical protein M378DRAFT_154859 [Amanita muscaria Koide BX008]